MWCISCLILSSKSVSRKPNSIAHSAPNIPYTPEPVFSAAGPKSTHSNQEQSQKIYSSTPGDPQSISAQTLPKQSLEDESPQSDAKKPKRGFEYGAEENFQKGVDKGYRTARTETLRERKAKYEKKKFVILNRS